MNRWNEIQQKLPQFSASALPKHLRSMTRFIPLMMILLVSAGVYAYQSTITYFPLDIICEEEGFHELGIIQTVDGVTVHLERAYADTNVIRMIARVEGMPHEQYSKQLRNGAGKLADEQGNNFMTVYEPDAGPCPSPETPGTRPPDGEILSVISTSGITSATLPYQMPLSTYFETYYAGTPETLSLTYNLTLQIPEATPTPVNPESTAEPQPTETTPLAFHFDFTVPVQGEIILEPQQTVENNGFAITLTKARIGKSSTTVQLCYPEPVGLDGLMFQDQSPIILTIDEYEGWQTNQMLNESDSSEAHWCVDYTYNMYFDQPPVMLTLNLINPYTQIDYGVEARDKWERLVELASEQGIEVELETYGDFIQPLERPTHQFTGESFSQALMALYTQAGLTQAIEGPWIFTVEIP
jgi:hypothetical protein